jgi:hypothetical protein
MAFSFFGYSVTSLHTNTESRCPILQAEDVHAVDLMKYSCVLDSLTGKKTIDCMKIEPRGARCHTGVKKIGLSAKIMGIDGTVTLNAKLFNC